MSPRWTYTEANASRWKPLFDTLISGQQQLEIPLADNAKSFASLKIRVGDALKWLADHYKRDRDDTFKPYAELKRKLRFGIGNDCLTLRVRRMFVFQVPVVSIEPPSPINLSVDAIKRMIVMMREEHRPLQSRKKFAVTLFQELTNRKNDSQLLAAELSLEKLNGEIAGIINLEL